MSKQSEAKERQGYTPKLIPQTCSKCASFKCDTVTHQHAFGSYTITSTLRCGIGGFAVKKTGSCDEWSRDHSANAPEHAPLSAGASVDSGTEVEATGEHENRAADRGCCVSACSHLILPVYYVGHPDGSFSVADPQPITSDSRETPKAATLLPLEAENVDDDSEEGGYVRPQ